MSVTSVTMVTQMTTLLSFQGGNISATPLHGVAISVPILALHHFCGPKNQRLIGRIRCEGMAENFELAIQNAPSTVGLSHIVYIVF
jgi:hypothetical protein